MALLWEMFNRLVRFYSAPITGRMQVIGPSRSHGGSALSNGVRRNLNGPIKKENTFAFGGLITGLSHEWRLKEQLN